MPRFREENIEPEIIYNLGSYALLQTDLCLITGAAPRVVGGPGKCVACVSPQLEKIRLRELSACQGFGVRDGELVGAGLHRSCAARPHLPVSLAALVSLLPWPVSSQHPISWTAFTAHRQEVLSLLAHSAPPCPLPGPCWVFQVKSRPGEPQHRPLAAWLRGRP